MTTDCVFCKIIAGVLPAEKIIETDEIIVIKDIHPKAPIHFLIIPKKHLSDIRNFEKKDVTLAGNIFLIAQELSAILNSSDFRLISNNGVQVGQVVFHLHVHFLAGKQYTDF